MPSARDKYALFLPKLSTRTSEYLRLKKQEIFLPVAGMTRDVCCCIHLISPEFGCITYAEVEKVYCGYLEEILLLSSHNFQSHFEL